MDPSHNHALALAAAISLALGLGSADARANVLHVDPSGEGQVLLFPYYTVNAGNTTYLSIVNATLTSKAVKLRFREGRNARTVLDFNLYLGAYDVWTGAVFSLDDVGPANLLTQDTSCTVPALRTNSFLPQLVDGSHYAPFRNFAYADSVNDRGPVDLSRTREGFFEVIEMGTLRVGSGLTQVVEEVNHNGMPGSLPISCDQLLTNWDSVSGGWTPTG